MCRLITRLQNAPVFPRNPKPPFVLPKAKSFIFHVRLNFCVRWERFDKVKSQIHSFGEGQIRVAVFFVFFLLVPKRR